MHSIARPLILIPILARIELLMSRQPLDFRWFIIPAHGPLRLSDTACTGYIRPCTCFKHDLASIKSGSTRPVLRTYGALAGLFTAKERREALGESLRQNGHGGLDSWVYLNTEEVPVPGTALFYIKHYSYDI